MSDKANKEKKPFDADKAMDEFANILNRPGYSLSEQLKKLQDCKNFMQSIYTQGYSEGHEVAMKELKL